MPELFKFIDKYFSKEDNEWQWTYSVEFEFVFNTLIINKITITDHAWKKKGREAITPELILDIFRAEVNNQRFFPTDYQGKRKVFVREGVPFDDKKYKLVFWFKDRTNNHLWIRNCHQQD